MTTVSTSAARADGAEIASQIPPSPPSSALTVRAASGSSTIRLSQTIVMPSPRGPTPPTAAGRLRLRRRPGTGTPPPICAADDSI